MFKDKKMYLCSLRPGFVTFKRIENSQAIEIKFFDLINFTIKKWTYAEEEFNTFFHIAIENDEKKIAYPKLDLKSFVYYEKNDSVKLYTNEASLFLSPEAKDRTKEDTLNFEKQEFLEGYIIGKDEAEITAAYIYQVAIQKNYQNLDLNEAERNSLKESYNLREVVNDSEESLLSDSVQESLNYSGDEESDDENPEFDYANCD